ncbi:MAG: hypothetical protein Q9178_005908 [Gyalolechia marmorata]
MADGIGVKPHRALLRALAESLQCFDQIEVASGLTREHEILYAKLSIQRTRLVLWGMCLHEDHDGAASSYQLWAAKLRELRDMFSSSKVLQDQLRLTTAREPDRQPSSVLPPSYSGASRGIHLFKRTFNAYSKHLTTQTGLQISMQPSILHLDDVPKSSIFVDGLRRLVDDLYISLDGLPPVHLTLRWRDYFYEEMSTVAEEADSLSLLVDASSGPYDLFANAASQRLLQREGRPRPTLWQSMPLSANSNRIEFWHKCLHIFFPKPLRDSSVVPTDGITATNPRSDEATPTKQQGYLAFSASLAGRYSDLCEIDLSTVKSGSELSSEMLRKLPWLWRGHRGCKVQNALVRPVAVRLIQM